jgi:hypothetical protein
VRGGHAQSIEMGRGEAWLLPSESCCGDLVDRQFPIPDRSGIYLPHMAGGSNAWWQVEARGACGRSSKIV